MVLRCDKSTTDNEASDWNILEGCFKFVSRDVHDVIVVNVISRVIVTSRLKTDSRKHLQHFTDISKF